MCEQLRSAESIRFPQKVHYMYECTRDGWRLEWQRWKKMNEYNFLVKCVQLKGQICRISHSLEWGLIAHLWIMYHAVSNNLHCMLLYWFAYQLSIISKLFVYHRKSYRNSPDHYGLLIRTVIEEYSSIAKYITIYIKKYPSSKKSSCSIEEIAKKILTIIKSLHQNLNIIQ